MFVFVQVPNDGSEPAGEPVDGEITASVEKPARSSFQRVVEAWQDNDNGGNALQTTRGTVDGIVGRAADCVEPGWASCGRWWKLVLVSVRCTCSLSFILLFLILILILFLFLHFVVPMGISPMGNLGRFPQGKQSGHQTRRTWLFSCACMNTQGLDTPIASQHNIWTLKNFNNFFLCSWRRQGLNLRSLYFESDALPTEPPRIVIDQY